MEACRPLVRLLVASALSAESGCVSSHKIVYPGPTTTSEQRIVHEPGSTNQERPTDETTDGAVDPASAGTKIGVVDLLEVLRRTPTASPVLARLQRDLDEAARQEREYAERFHRSRTYRSWAMSPRSQAFREAFARIMPTVEPVARALADAQGFGAVLAKGHPETFLNTVYFTDAVDLTNQVIEELNRRFPE